MTDENEDLSEEKFATDLLQQIEAKVTQKLKAAGIRGVSVKVNRADYSLSFSGDAEQVAAAEKFLEEERRAKLRDSEELEDLSDI